ncbi:RNA polymerase sigma factor [Nannocystis radixulma]|uniref:Sigma-70 family RNA polymerase sigma factor n=1 Tax=Nannocystis radixulma TaxID=2995305 RepID=A0ABT5BIY6_9BACT|nr:sigma-70 family RNA polymerase sigma factor [Nannocystis radixulma]MDC0673555.1 sigma-70 family RNA polymerase sigma factor [Nannocystis radixulma]
MTIPAPPLAVLGRVDDAALADEQSAVRVLVVAARGGDAAAFGRLHRLHGRMVHAIVLRCVPHEEAADLVQDVFLSAWKMLPGLGDPDAFGAWLARIARNRAIDFLRARRPHAELPTDLPLPERPVTEAREVLAALCALPEAYAETLIMRLVEGMTGPEIAARTGMTPGSVRVNLHRGMALLRRRLSGEHER